MKLIKKAVRSFKRILKRGRKPPTPPQHQDIGMLAANPEIKKAMTDLIAMAKSTSNAVEINEHKIDIDCSSLLLTCFSFGYTPSQIFDLLAKTYGSIMACAPEVTIVDGQKVTRDMLQTMFFQLCIKERTHLTKTANEVSNGFAVGRGTIH